MESAGRCGGGRCGPALPRSRFSVRRLFRRAWCAEVIHSAVSERIGFGAESIGFAAEFIGFAAEFIRFVAASIYFVPERIGFVAASIRFAAERIGFAASIRFAAESIRFTTERIGFDGASIPVGTDGPGGDQPLGVAWKGYPSENCSCEREMRDTHSASCPAST